MYKFNESRVGRCRRSRQKSGKEEKSHCQLKEYFKQCTRWRKYEKGLRLKDLCYKKMPKTYVGEKTTSSTNGVGKTWILHAED
jgi:hypothetical protein